MRRLPWSGAGQRCIFVRFSPRDDRCSAPHRLLRPSRSRRQKRTFVGMTALVSAVSIRNMTAGEVRAVFLSMVRDGAEPDAAAITVCVAAGSNREEAVDRLGQFA